MDGTSLVTTSEEVSLSFASQMLNINHVYVSRKMQQLQGAISRILRKYN